MTTCEAPIALATSKHTNPMGPGNKPEVVMKNLKLKLEEENTCFMLVLLNTG